MEKFENHFSQFGIRIKKDDTVLKEVEKFAYDVSKKLYQRFVRELGMSLVELEYTFDSDMRLFLINEGQKDRWDEEVEEVEEKRNG